MLKISKRLGAVASLVSEGMMLADVGTDHGYVPIYLMQQNRIRGAIAMDINPGPLKRAEEHIAIYNMGGYIKTRLSDGVAALVPGEADTILCAGMGGGLMMHILETGQEVCQRARELVLQPQSELARFRAYLRTHGYVTDAEEMIQEDGKYYPMMRVHYDPFRPKEDGGLFDTYGSLLLKERHPVLKEFLVRERRLNSDICAKLAGSPSSEAQKVRMQEILNGLACNERALSYYSQDD